ncbi:MAG: OB-fold protein [Stenotrophomonas sp.]|uniref:OB-fold protein n=1 Tax=Stenotrophomonas sp. TaxID=69392 RepID=UPI003D6C8F79
MKTTFAMLLALAVPAMAAASEPVDAAQLANAFFASKAAVAGAYEGKSIAISGTVQKHDENGNGEPLLLVGSDPTDTYVTLRFVKSDEAKASALKVGAQISVTCTGDFKALPSGKDCHL